MQRATNRAAAALWLAMLCLAGTARAQTVSIAPPQGVLNLSAGAETGK